MSDIHAAFRAYNRVMSTQVRPVRFEDEDTSRARPTRTKAVALRAGEAIEVFDGGRWVACTITGAAHSELVVRRAD
jgi:hypothetical protein